MRILPVVLAALSLTTFAQETPPPETKPAAQSKKPSAADDAAIRKTFTGYQKALSKKDGKAATSLIDSATLQYYAGIQKTALEGDAATVRKLPLIDKLMVLRLRAELEPAKLKAMSPEQLLSYGVDRGWVGSNTSENTLGELTVEGDKARGQALVRGQVTPLFHEFRREGGKWKMNLVELMRAVAPAMSEAARRMDMTEDEFVLFALEQGLGRKPTDAIWNAPQAK